MDNRNLKIVFFGSSIVSAYWNGAATYYRGIVKALYHMKHDITFYEPDIYDRQKHRDLINPEYCTVKVYQSEEQEILQLLEEASTADVIIKTSGIGKNDAFLEQEILKLKKKNNLIVFWDVDAPATLDRIHANPDDPFNQLIPHYDYIFTYGGGAPVIEAYETKGAKRCIPIYNALDTETHFPVASNYRFQADLSFLGNRLPDRESRVEEFFLTPASLLSEKSFLLGGNGWQDKPMPANVNYIGHVYTEDHNVFNCSSLVVLNISRSSMAKYGFSPATRVFEAAGAAACIITDYWEGIELFFEPGTEILVAHNGHDVANIIQSLTEEKAVQVGQAAYKKVIKSHTYNNRAQILQSIFNQSLLSTEAVV
ncbi:Uncharacterized protein conserved in bacteria [Legionella wadsworthii]|uniref:Uncharacterized protein conserved in bacteria n=1 Tax=Legionella wadsworthii TaxID=28088 RepID=A0A378M0H6_9GAMM|nr:glycosyltransferase [Legionella wadsworthii]STY29831.1 Uncharacterized protein conserved in bacteria [Legionella wadsworthii]